MTIGYYSFFVLLFSNDQKKINKIIKQHKKQTI